MKENKITQPESREIQRSDINFANYNPRKITQEARKEPESKPKACRVAWWYRME
jgi:hypothetical protein